MWHLTISPLWISKNAWGKLTPQQAEQTKNRIAEAFRVFAQNTHHFLSDSSDKNAQIGEFQAHFEWGTSAKNERLHLDTIFRSDRAISFDLPKLKEFFNEALKRENGERAMIRVNVKAYKDMKRMLELYNKKQGEKVII